MLRRKPVFLVKTSSRLRHNLACQGYAAFGFALQEMKSLSFRIHEQPNNIFPSHRHVAVVFPAQALDGCPITVAMLVHPLCCEDFSEITRTDGFCSRQLFFNHRSCVRFSKPPERSCGPFSRNIVLRYDC